MTISRFSTWTFLICLLLSFILVAHLLFGFLTPIAVALVIVSLFSGVHRKILSWTKNREYLAAGLATLLVFLSVLIPLSGFLVALIQQSITLFHATEQLTTNSGLADWTSALKNYIETLNSYLTNFNISISPERVQKTAENLVQTMGSWLYDSIGLVATNLVSLILNFLLTIALVFVFFVSGRATKHFIMELIPIPDSEKERVVRRFRELSSAVFVGNGLISLSEGILGGLSFFIFGMQGGLIWGVLIAITAFLPLIGASIVIWPATAYLFLTADTWQAIVFLVFNTAQIITLDTLVKPRLIGTKSQMHAALVFMSILAGVQIYGVIGLFYGPLLVTVFLTLAEIYKEHYRERLLKS